MKLNRVHADVDIGERAMGLCRERTVLTGPTIPVDPSDEN